MRRFTINLASRPFRNNVLHWTGLAVVVGLLIAFTWYNVSDYRAAEGDLERWMQALREHRESIALVDRDIARMKSDVAGMDLVAFSKRSDFANEIILSRLFSWTSLFDRLEQVMPPKVRLRSIRPSLGKEMIEITIDGMTPDHSSLIDFEEALIASEYFTFVYPVQESSKVKAGEINFSVTFGYLPEGGDSRSAPMPFADAAPPEADQAEEAPAETSGEETVLQETAPAGTAEQQAAEPKPAAPQTSRPAPAEHPPATPTALADESVQQDPNDGDPNAGDPNDDDPNTPADPNEDDGDGDGGTEDRP